VVYAFSFILCVVTEKLAAMNEANGDEDEDDMMNGSHDDDDDEDAEAGDSDFALDHSPAGRVQDKVAA